MYQRFADKPDEVAKTCGFLMRNGKVCMNKHSRDGLCWRHRKQTAKHDDDDVIIGGTNKVTETIKELRQIAKEEGLK